jgi:hypothetical protein
MRTLSCLVVVIMASALLPVPADAAPKGSYLETCQNVRDTGGRNGEVSAECRDSKGRYRYSSLRYRECQGDIANVSGQLTCAGGRPGTGRPDNGWGGRDDRPGSGWGSGRLPAGSWTQSCRNYDMRGSLLTAECKAKKRWVETQIDVRACRGGRVANQYGNLVCEN